jgi:hypothetical protein
LLTHNKKHEPIASGNDLQKNQMNEFPSQIENLLNALSQLPGINEVDCSASPLEEFELNHIPLVPFGDWGQSPSLIASNQLVCDGRADVPIRRCVAAVQSSHLYPGDTCPQSDPASPFAAIGDNRPP